MAPTGGESKLEVLADRYQVVSRLGGGGMAVVYKARDILLNRDVTIKVLRDQYVSDTEFVKRFHREAQAVASLSHPNIVSIYDVGREGDRHYLVMEYVEGKTLKDLIRQEAPLDAERAILIAAQLCDALNHAHQHGVIHRDIKPHNILLTAGDKVKLTDFGIARATTTDTITFTGTIVGSVYYFSPEQAKGELTGAKSDLYSVGVVLYEMLTGNLPFGGDSPISVALKHIQSDPTPPRILNPGIPVALERAILKAMEKNPDRRYRDAGAMRLDLLQVCAGGDSIKKMSEDTIISTSRKRRKHKNRGRRLRPLGWGMLLILLAALAYGGWQTGLNYLVVGESRVPEVTGKPLQEAESLLYQAGLKTDVVGKAFDPQIPEGYVVGQSPVAGQLVRRGRLVELELSMGPELQQVPNVVGIQEKVAEITLTNHGFAVAPADARSRVYHPEVPVGAVISQNPPPDNKYPEGTEVTLVVSKGVEPKYILMSDLRGMTLEEARNRLTEERLELGLIAYEGSREYFSGQVTSQDIMPGDQVLQGTAVNMVLSRGPGPSAKTATITIPVPNDMQQHLVKIEVEDGRGTRVEYEKTHPSGGWVEQHVPFYGKGKIRIFIDGKLAKEQPVS